MFERIFRFGCEHPIRSFFIVAILWGMIERHWQQYQNETIIIIACTLLIFLIFILIKEYKKTPLKKERTMDEFQEIIYNNIYEANISQTIKIVQEYIIRKNISSEEAKNKIISSLPVIMKKATHNGLFTEKQEEDIDKILEQYAIVIDDIPPSTLEIIAKEKTLRNLINSNIDPILRPTGLPFVFQKNEILIWAFINAYINGIKTTKEYIAGSRGFSMRIAKGLYYRVGSYKGKSIERDQVISYGCGHVAVTSKNIYIKTDSIVKKIKNESLVSVELSDKGVILNSSGTRSKPIELCVDDPYFLLNIIQNASNWA